MLPMTPDAEPLRADVVIRAGRIAAVVAGGVAEPVGEVVDAGDALVLPGFVQCHVHVVQSLLRHQADGLELLEWLRRRTWPYEAALDGDATAAAAELGIAELLCGGTTTVVDFGSIHHHDRVFAAAEELGIRFISGKTHMDTGDGVPPGLLEDRDRSLAEAERLGRRWHGAAGGRLRYAVAPRFALSCSRDLLEGCAQLARRHGWLLETHAAENRDENAAVEAATGSRTIPYLDGVGLTGRDVVLAHGVWLDDSEVALLAGTGTGICHCPGANLKLASGIADVPRLQAAGVAVGLGADGPPCNNRLSIFHELALAGTLHGLRHGPRAPDARQVLAMATRVGAAVAGLEGEAGVLRPGALADVVVVDLTGWATLPAGDPASRLVFGATAADIRHTIVDGRVVVRNGRLQTAAPELIRERAVAAWTATRRRMEVTT